MSSNIYPAFHVFSFNFPLVGLKKGTYGAGRYGRSFPWSYSSPGYLIIFLKIARAITDAPKVIHVRDFFLSI
jgi:hypothetical protein